MSDTLLRSAVELAQVPSAVPLGGETLIEPDAPVLVEYVQRHLRPRFERLGALDIIDLPANQFAVRFGTGTDTDTGTGAGPCLALVAYTPTQHHNLMADPWSGRIATPVSDGIDEPCLFGQGITQNKAHQACLLALADWLVSEQIKLDGTLLLCVNNEGRSSHECSHRMLDALPTTPDLLVQLFPTGFDVTVGNRGRIDLYVRVTGTATHSSTPPPGGGVIAATTAVLARVEKLNEEVTRRTDPELGREQVIPYQVVFDPLAPHTLPNAAKITLDRRLLPGTDPEDTAAELRKALDEVATPGCEVTVEPGVTMLPARFPDDRADLLAPLDAAIAEHLKRPARHTMYGGSFDAGGPSSRGIPTVMFGVPEEGDLLGDDFVRICDLRAQEAILRRMVTGFFAGGSRS
ncbi:M20 family metallopeptidase [Pseudonocardia acaciae]|uniref:M20 family metallopeptidase n=1 Tax=Pseudonocardia acaciae TaxID=551276 RepID=UPI00048DCF23|nr:peptidase dimerization domain-containing protein [Pseudonocardia acaciae]